MATTTQTGNSIFAYMRETGDSTWLKTVCNTTLEVNRSAALIESETKCETLRAAGSITNEIPIELVVKFNPAVDELGYSTLHGWFANKASVDVLIADDETSPIIYSENAAGSITEFNTTFNTNEFITVSLTVSVSGATTLNIPV